ncbi:MAG: glycoside hydrolase family 9 protein [Spirochaetales bacterium]|nr:glycoside hydrolase family 9 protein [Spirochaetales bacterium]
MKECKFISKKVKISILSTVIILFLISTLSLVPLANGGGIEVNFAKALQYSQFMYDANMCGTGVDENSLYKWRSNCHTYDAELPLDSKNTNMSDAFISRNKAILDPDGDGFLDVAGGYHDAGDHVKFGMPEMYSASTLGWGYYEFRDAYAATQQTSHIETILRYFNDYFMKVSYLDDSGKLIAFCYQVGDGDVDHAFWQAPENDEMFRRGWFATSELPSTDCITAAAASLAVNYLNFKDTDPSYAEESLKYAKALFAFAENTGTKEVNRDGPKGYYQSSKWEDDYCWAALWLFLCTEDTHYIDETFKYLDYYAPSTWTHCWNDVWAGVMCLMGAIDDAHDANSQAFEDHYKEVTGKSPYEEIDFWSQIAKLADGWASGQNVTVTPGGYAFLNQWGSARYNTATQLCALVYDKHHGDRASSKSEWAKGQMTYIMGDNPMNRCYIVGYSDISAKFPHHRAASGTSMAEDPDDHRFVLYGALVGGPGQNDEHKDVTADYIYNEVTIDYNAAFVGACAGLYHFYGDSSMQITPDFPPDPPVVEDGNTYWVEAFCVEIIQDDGPKATELTFYVRSDIGKPSKNLSVRYYFDSTGMKSIDRNEMTIQELYDQSFVEAGYDALLTGPHLYKGNIYYVEVSWDGYSIANSNKKYQFALGTYAWQNSWNPSDDWSYQGLKVELDAWKGVVAKHDKMCIYDKGVLVGGIEPDGTTPDVPTPTPEGTETPATPTPGAFQLGDVNHDSKINIVDALLIANHYVGMNPDNFYAEQADTNCDGSVNIVDALLTARFYVGLINRFC